MKKALVTGVAGFIGSQVARGLLRQGVEVVGIDNMNDYYDPRLKKYRAEILAKEFAYEFHEVDIENRAGLAGIFNTHRFDCVFNLAARAGVNYSLSHPEVYVTTNVMGTLNLLEEMKNKGVEKIVLASTSSLYAGEAMPFSEDAAVNRPISAYAASKKAAELMCYNHHYHYGIDCSVVRYFTVFGPAGRPDMSLFRFIRWIDEGKPLEIYGDGEQSRDFTYVDDIAAGTILAAKPVGYEIFNLGGGRRPVTLNAVISQIEAHLGKTARKNHHPALKADIHDTQAEVSKARRMLNWRPEVELAEGLKRTIQWYVENRDFARGIPLP